MTIISELSAKLLTAEEAAGKIKSGDRIYIHSNAAVPQTLVGAMTARALELTGVKIYQIITLGNAPYAAAELSESFYVHNLFIGPNLRQAVDEGRADYTPIFFSDLCHYFETLDKPMDVCLLSASPPDKDGFLSLGVSLDCTLSAMSRCPLVLCEINDRMPNTRGDTRLHISQISYAIKSSKALPELPIHPPSPVELKIGEYVASLVEDGATLQMGIGEIPNAVLKMLANKRELGVHSEMFSDGVLDLFEQGIITNSKKTVLPGKMAVGFSMGSQRLYDFLHENEDVVFKPLSFINEPAIIAQNYRMTAINSALQIDLTGQVCADSLGTHMYSGCGGQVDFVRGASKSQGGKAIIALPSTAAAGHISRLVPMLNPGAGVVTTRADVYYVVTEYGIANLHGKNMKDRVRALIDIAHPSFRDNLEKEAHSFPWYR